MSQKIIKKYMMPWAKERNVWLNKNDFFDNSRMENAVVLSRFAKKMPIGLYLYDGRSYMMQHGDPRKALAAMRIDTLSDKRLKGNPEVILFPCDKIDYFDNIDKQYLKDFFAYVKKATQ